MRIVGVEIPKICDEIAKNCTFGRICKDKTKGHFRLAKANHSLAAANIRLARANDSLAAANIRLARANDSLAAANHRNDHTKPLLKSS